MKYNSTRRPEGKVACCGFLHGAPSVCSTECDVAIQNGYEI
jgi:hypothetical protein